MQRRPTLLLIVVVLLLLSPVIGGGCHLLFPFKPAPGADASSGDAAPGRILVSPTSGLVTSEEGTTASFTVTLERAPTATVTIAVESDSPDEAVASPAMLTFGVDSWDGQEAIVTGQDDTIIDGRVPFTISVLPAQSEDPYFNDVDPPDVRGENRSDDGPARLSIDSDGGQLSKGSFRPTISGDGSLVAFVSDAPELGLVSSRDVFLMTRASGSVLQLTTGLDGKAPDHSSFRPQLAAEGGFASFRSRATNLVLSDTNDADDIFVVDLATMQIERVSVDSLGGEANGWSWQVPPGAISADGRFVVFWSEATNLVPDDTNNVDDIFLRDRQNKTTTRISVSPEKGQGDGPSWAPTLSNDGRYLLFLSDATNLVPGDTNGKTDLFLHDTTIGQTTRVSVGDSGQQGDGDVDSGDISDDGRAVAFSSFAENLVPGDTGGYPDVFWRDLETQKILRLSVTPGGESGDGGSVTARISADGRSVLFRSFASNLVPDDTNGVTDLFLWQADTNSVRRVSVNRQGEGADADCYFPEISRDGRFAVFYTTATNLVAGDTNDVEDIFIVEL